MKNKMLVSSRELMNLQRSGACLIVDCRFNLGDARAGYRAYQEAHIPGAVYANLDKDLSSPVTALSGRHPLPDTGGFSQFLAGIGWAPGSTMVAYDDIGGAFAARLWWLVKYFGYDQVLLLDGGFPAWLEAGLPVNEGEADMQVARAPVIALKANDEMVLSAAETKDALARESILLVDARAAERYRGDVEPLDTVAGHVPGAINLPFGLHLSRDMRFKTKQDIRDNWQSIHAAIETVQSGAEANRMVHMCGSGVTACFNQFASELAGIDGSRIYAGSWSEWIRDPARGVETG